MIRAHEDSGTPSVAIAQCKRLGVKRVTDNIVANTGRIAILVIVVHIESAQPADIARQVLIVGCINEIQ